ncbi:YdaS [Bacillus subtilis QB928]|nr:YdaS [Bacillus subtilis QB928]
MDWARTSWHMGTEPRRLCYFPGHHRGSHLRVLAGPYIPRAAEGSLDSLDTGGIVSK